MCGCVNANNLYFKLCDVIDLELRLRIRHHFDRLIGLRAVPR